MFRSTAHVYDLVYDAAGKDYTAEASALVGLVEERQPEARTLLDVACGTGRHLAELTGRFEVTGLDLDAGMLAVARERLPDVTLHETDMRTFDLGRTFDVVVCLFSSIAYLADTSELHAAFGRMAAHLAPGGVLVVDGWLRPEAFDDGKLVSALAAQGESVVVTRVTRTRRDGNKVTMEMHHLVGTPEEVEHVVDTHHTTMFTDAEHRAAFDAAGLGVEVVESPHPGRDRYVARRT